VAGASLIGTTLPGATFPVELGKVRELARAVGAEPDGKGRPDVPLTFTVTLTHWLEGELGGLEALGLDLRRLLHGDVTWEYAAPVGVGDVLTATRTVTDVTTKAGRRGGEMTLVTLETVFTNQDGVRVVTMRDTLIERAA
jgi:hypothetical protein